MICWLIAAIGAGTHESRALERTEELPSELFDLESDPGETRHAWVAVITVGTYPTELEAAAGYNWAARKLGLPEDAMNVLPVQEANVLGLFEEEEGS